MDKLDERLLQRIEKVLKIQFREWQAKYMLDIPMVLDMGITGRRTGKTLVYVIKLLFLEDKPIRAYDISEVSKYSDWYASSIDLRHRDNFYTNWFKNYVFEIYSALTRDGIKPRPVFFNQRDEYNYYTYNYYTKEGE